MSKRQPPVFIKIVNENFCFQAAHKTAPEPTLSWFFCISTTKFKVASGTTAYHQTLHPKSRPDLV